MIRILRLAVFWVALFALAPLTLIAIAYAADPAPVLTYSKTAAVDGSYIEWTLAVSNSGNSDSEEQSVADTLPSGADWAIVEDTIGCELGPSTLANRLKLSCDKFIVPKRDLEGVDTDGLRFVTIGGIVDKCGDYLNTALFNFAILRSTAVSIACPATPTPVPTNTPTAPTATSTPVPAVTTGPVELPTLTPTKTAIPSSSVIPLPPRSGNSPMDVADSPSNQLSAFSVALLAMGAGVALFAIPLSYTRARRVKR